MRVAIFRRWKAEEDMGGEEAQGVGAVETEGSVLFPI